MATVVIRMTSLFYLSPFFYTTKSRPHWTDADPLVERHDSVARRDSTVLPRMCACLARCYAGIQVITGRVC